MSGICGIYSKTNPIDRHLVQRMCDAVSHRGPDDERYIFVNTRSRTYEIFGGADTPVNVIESAFPYAPKHNLCNSSEPFLNGGYDLALESRRLAIGDLSAAGHQPMCNEDGSIWLWSY